MNWKVLWKIITQHEDGVCDKQCRDLDELDGDINIQHSLDWLMAHDYLHLYSSTTHWGEQFPQYVLNWNTLKEKLRVAPAIDFRPISQEKIYERIASLKEFKE